MIDLASVQWSLKWRFASFLQQTDDWCAFLRKMRHCTEAKNEDLQQKNIGSTFSADAATLTASSVEGGQWVQDGIVIVVLGQKEVF